MKGWNISVRWRSVLLGIGVGVLTMLCVCAAAAAMMVRGIVDVETMSLWAAGITVGSGLLGCLTAMLAGGEALDAALVATTTAQAIAKILWSTPTTGSAPA